MFDLAKEPRNKTRVGTLKTETGIKDTFFDSFLDRIFSAISGKKGVAAQQAIDAEVARMPSAEAKIFSPVWRIKGTLFTAGTAFMAQWLLTGSTGLDPHRDTPVEILHVILLGFVKYLWRDVIARLSPEQKATLAIRISAFDVSGLGLSPLPGFTLVQYAGSLVGRDFRAIAQVAPHVLKDLVPKECFAAWLSLSSLIPIVWQPKIVNVEAHLVRPIYKPSGIQTNHLLPFVGDRRPR